MDKHSQKAENQETSLSELMTDSDNDLFSQARSYWFSGDWESLTGLTYEKIKVNSQRPYLVLFVASAYQQLNQFKQGEHYTRLALQCGAEPIVVARVCIAGAENILGRIAALQKKDAKAKDCFLASVSISDCKDLELIAHSRAVREMGEMGLLPQSMDLVQGQIQSVMENCTYRSVEVLDLLSLELDILKNELALAQKRNQIYNNFDSLNKETFEEKIRSLSTSQLGQDLWVLENTHYKKNGFFVEFGATDGVLLSNSFLLEKEFDWNGICSEPNPKFYSKLKENRNCNLSDECVAGKSGEKVEFVLAGELGGMRKYIDYDNHAQKRQLYLDNRDVVSLNTISLNDFLIKHNAPKCIDYLSIDTEGSEYEIIKEFPFDEWDIRMITIEHNYASTRSKIRQVLVDGYGYQCVEAKWDDWYYKE